MPESSKLSKSKFVGIRANLFCRNRVGIVVFMVLIYFQKLRLSKFQVIVQMRVSQEVSLLSQNAEKSSKYEAKPSKRGFDRNDVFSEITE